MNFCAMSQQPIQAQEKKKKIWRKHVIYSYILQEEYDPKSQKNVVMGMGLSETTISSGPIVREGAILHEVTVIDSDGDVLYTTQFLASTNGRVTARLLPKSLTEKEAINTYFMTRQCDRGAKRCTPKTKATCGFSNKQKAAVNGP